MRRSLVLTLMAAGGFALDVAVCAPLAAQSVATALAPDTITVGAQVRVGVRIVAPDGEPQFPDTLPVGDDVENVARVSVTTGDSAAAHTFTGVYTVTGWRPGPLRLDTLLVPVRAADGTTRSVRVDLPDAVVVSVLPADTAGLEPKPARGVLGPSWVWWLWALGVLLALALIGALVWWWRRRRARRGAPGEPAVPPRERAIAALDEAWQARPHTGRPPDPFYEKVSRIVRAYLDELDERWSLARTTPELSAALLSHLTPAEAARLRELLREADTVKFARAWPEADAAERFWRSAREWVATFREPGAELAAEATAAGGEGQT